MRNIKTKIINFFKWLWMQLKDWHNLIVLAVVTIVMTSPIWVCGILGLINNSTILIGIAGGYLAFWLGPATPFWPLCIAITLLIRKILDKFRNNK